MHQWFIGTGTHPTSPTMLRFTFFQPLAILSILFSIQGAMGGGFGFTCTDFELIGSGSSAAVQA
ncbi:hypothetical protein BDN72DRAFT_840416 [Pluteus cervinus]|uniref:Uncharacterized protein n=1 Tax=Pluteus cervinus TaxID=181527 RepID=A0ACD3AV63_9AGAR|nr:hypothetical protein BDN72DRAFT_840416 [Pluteus cervinus]